MSKSMTSSLHAQAKPVTFTPALLDINYRSHYYWMLGQKKSSLYICSRCLRSIQRNNGLGQRTFATTAHLPLEARSSTSNQQQSNAEVKEKTKEPGAMSRLLEQMSERNLEEGGRSAQKAVEEAGFDEELKQRLLDRIEGAKFKADNQQALAQANLPSSAGRQTREIAGGAAWTGTESLEDATLRMLNDSSKPLQIPVRIPSPAQPPRKVDTGRPKNAPSSGARLANARDRSSMYSYLRDDALSKKEREEMRQELKERFTPGGRPMPVSLTGLQSLANERIDDAIARGLFKNLPRGKKIERDYNMSSPFLDTTEYFLNKMIKKQDIVPPWIEKQQELVSTANKFRSRIRNDWKRHAARMIASRGGSIESQIQRAREYARAEAIVNPPRKKKETINTVDNEGHVSQISLSGELQPPAPGESEPSMKITVDEVMSETIDVEDSPALEEPVTIVQPGEPKDVSVDPRVIDGAVFPFRDKSWEATEQSYHNLAIENLNTMTRTYNLMAPNLAKKPYFSLERELRSCFADVAPQLADEILERSRAPKLKIEVITHRKGSVLENLAGGSAKVYDDRRQPYGFKELWRDVFGKKETA